MHPMLRLLRVVRCRKRAREEPVHINTWSIWQTYAGYFRQPFLNLEKVATDLVAADIASYAYTTLGNAHWRDGESVVTKPLSIHHHDRSHARIELPGVGGFVEQCAYDASAMRVGEQSVVNDSRLAGC
jgi:hypothetical protein